MPSASVMPKNNAYKPPAPPTYTYRGAQVARFDNPSTPTMNKFNEDALPEMPTWDHAKTRRIEDNSGPRAEDMDMEP